MKQLTVVSNRSPGNKGEYRIVVSGRAEKPNTRLTSGEDKIKEGGKVIEGQAGNGRDVFRYTGRIVETDLASGQRLTGTVVRAGSSVNEEDVLQRTDPFINKGSGDSAPGLDATSNPANNTEPPTSSSTSSGLSGILSRAAAAGGLAVAAVVSVIIALAGGG